MCFEQPLSWADQTTLSLKIATADWGTLAVIKPGLLSSAFPRVFGTQWRFSETAEGNLKVANQHLAEQPDMQYRLVAVDTDGVQYIPTTERRTKSGQIAPNCEAVFEFGDPASHRTVLPLRRVREIDWQARPYEKVEFRNVSLQPGHRTTVEVKDFGGADLTPPSAQEPAKGLTGADEADLTVGTAGTAPLHYQWYKSTPEQPDTSTATPEARLELQRAQQQVSDAEKQKLLSEFPRLPFVAWQDQWQTNQPGAALGPECAHPPDPH